MSPMALRVLQGDFSNASLVLDIWRKTKRYTKVWSRTLKRKKKEFWVGEKSPTTSSSLVVPLHQSMVYYCCHLLAILVASDPLPRVSTTASSCSITDVAPDPVILFLQPVRASLPS